jgi:hypothetical protein
MMLLKWSSILTFKTTNEKFLFDYYILWFNLAVQVTYTCLYGTIELNKNFNGIS